MHKGTYRIKRVEKVFRFYGFENDWPAKMLPFDVTICQMLSSGMSAVIPRHGDMPWVPIGLRSSGISPRSGISS